MKFLRCVFDSAKLGQALKNTYRDTMSHTSRIERHKAQRMLLLLGLGGRSFRQKNLQGFWLFVRLHRWCRLQPGRFFHGYACLHKPAVRKDPAGIHVIDHACLHTAALVYAQQAT